MKKQVEYLLKVICYTLIFCFIHSSNVINYLKPNTEENKIYNKNVHLNATDFIDFITIIVMSVINISTVYKLNTSSSSRIFGIDDLGIESLLIHTGLTIYETFYQVLFEKKWLVLVHHLLLVFGYGYYIYRNFAQYYLNSFGMTEITNLFLVPLLLMKRNNIGLNNIFYIGIGIIFSFLIYRLYLIPYLIYQSFIDINILPEDMNTNMYMGRSVGIMMLLMSLFWFYKLCNGAIKEYRKLKR